MEILVPTRPWSYFRKTTIALMKFILQLSVLVCIFSLESCLCAGGDGTLPEDEALTDSLQRAGESNDYTLEYLLNVNDERELIDRYGKDHVIHDTLWGAEGFFEMGTIVRTDSVSRVEISWQNDSLRTNIVSVTLVSESNWYGDSLASGMWRSFTGVKLGMSLEDVEKINGRPFQFSGFGWDYAGGLMSWEAGTLEGKGLSIQMAEGTGYDSLPEAEYTKILGDVPVMSNNPTARKSGARIWSISVAKVQ